MHYWPIHPFMLLEQVWEKQNFKPSSLSQDIETDNTKTERKRNKSDSESITPLNLLNLRLT